MDNAVTRYWMQHYVSDLGVCALCGNRGRVDTTASARTPLGVPCGRVDFCLCPNGQNMRAHGVPPSRSTSTPSPKSPHKKPPRGQ